MHELFRVVVADCPWQFGDKLPGPGRGAAKHYDTMSASELARLVLPNIADDAHLFFWRVASMQDEALAVIDAWGFTVKSELVWCKRTKNGLRHFGMGRHVRLEHEVCLIATRGKGAGILDRSMRSIFHTYAYLDNDGGGSFDACVGEHSKKPDEFYNIVEMLCPGPRVELFARETRQGWTTLGNQVEENPTMLEVGIAL
jgi:N6-adenosine-specific RNA methylase IME4